MCLKRLPLSSNTLNPLYKIYYGIIQRHSYRPILSEYWDKKQRNNQIGSRGKNTPLSIKIVAIHVENKEIIQ